MVSALAALNIIEANMAVPAKRLANLGRRIMFEPFVSGAPQIPACYVINSEDEPRLLAETGKWLDAGVENLAACNMPVALGVKLCNPRVAVTLNHHKTPIFLELTKEC